MGRASGASTKSAGSGGAFVGACADTDMLDHVQVALATIGSKTIVPIVKG